MKIVSRIRRAPIREAARILGLSAYAVRQGVIKGKIPHIKIGKKYYVDIALTTKVLEREAMRNIHETYYCDEENIINFNNF